MPETFRNKRLATPPADHVAERSERPCFEGFGAAPRATDPAQKRKTPLPGESGASGRDMPQWEMGARPAQSASGTRRHRDGLATIHGRSPISRRRREPDRARKTAPRAGLPSWRAGRGPAPLHYFTEGDAAVTLRSPFYAACFMRRAIGQRRAQRALSRGRQGQAAARACNWER